MWFIATVLFRRLFLIVCVFSAIFGSSVFYTLNMPKQYEARMKFFVNHERPDSVVSPDSRNAVMRAEVSESDVNSEIELLTNAGTIRQVVMKHGLHRAGLAESSPAQDQLGKAIERATRTLAQRLVITPVRKASLIQVVYSSEDPAQASEVLSSLAEFYLQHHLRIHRTAGAQEFFRAQAAQYQRQLLAAQDRLATFRQSSQVVLLGEQKELSLRRVMDNEQALSEVSTARNETAAKVLSLKQQLSSLTPRVVTQSRVVPNQYSVERLHTMVAELRNKRTQLLVKFQEDDRLVKEVDDQIRDTIAALDAASKLSSIEQTTDANPLRVSLEAELARAEIMLAGLEARLTSLLSLLADSRARLIQLDRATSANDGLNREIHQAEENLLLYSKKQEEARIADSLDQQKIANVSIAEAPSRPYLPTKPNVPLNLALGFVVASFVSIGLAFALELTRQNIERPDELQALGELPVLATVPLQRA